MNSKHLKQLLVLLVIFLVCSTTPATATQNSGTQSNNNDYIDLFNETYIKDMTKLLNSFDEATNTELTPEQDTYLETHEPKLLSKAEAILYNLQQFLNILIAEYYIENTTTHNKNKENNENNLETVKILDKYNSTELLCTLEDLSEGRGRDPKDPYNDTKLQKVDTKHVIIHVKDPKCGCMEFVGLSNINKDANNISNSEIKYQKGKINITCTWTNFKEYYPPTKGKDRDMYSITTFNCSTQLALECMYSEKETKLISRRTNLDNGKTICTIFAGVGGVSVAVAGAYRLCDYCNSLTRQRITEIMETPEEAAPLVKSDGLVKIYTRITEEVHNNQYCNKCTTGIGIVTCGTLILLGSIIGFILCSKGVDVCNKKLECLKEYCPLTYC